MTKQQRCTQEQGQQAVLVVEKQLSMSINSNGIHLVNICGHITQ